MRNLACSQSSLHHICDIFGFGYLLVSAFWVKYFRKNLHLSGFKCNHDCNLESISSRCQQKGIKFNSQKLDLKAEEVPFDFTCTCLPQRVLSQISKEGRRSSRCRIQRDLTIYSGLMEWLRWFLSIALRIPTAHDFCVISARKLARARTQRKKFPSS